MGMIRPWIFSDKNFGDALTPYLLDRYGISYELVDTVVDANFFGIGSILRRVPANPERDIVVWSSGMISPLDGIDLRFSSKVLVTALRGEHSRRRVVSQNAMSCVLGDGGLLARDVFDYRAITKTHDIGIIPHMSDKGSKILKETALELNAKIINVFDDVGTVFDDIASCRRILSSSLHGVIVADAFDVPNMAVKFGDTRNRNDEGKFRVYGSSIGRDVNQTLVCDPKCAATLSKQIDERTEARGEAIEIVVQQLRDQLFLSRDLLCV